MPRKRRQPGPDDRVRALHMLVLAREAIAEFADIEEQEFHRRRVFQTSLAWYLQAIGEAASRVSDEARGRIPVCRGVRSSAHDTYSRTSTTG
ncbi:MAG: hypothetical protein R3B68_06040 [Phycisphaerales bacterium]